MTVCICLWAINKNLTNQIHDACAMLWVQRTKRGHGERNPHQVGMATNCPRQFGRQCVTCFYVLCESQASVPLATCRQNCLYLVSRDLPMSLVSCTQSLPPANFGRFSATFSRFMFFAGGFLPFWVPFDSNSYEHFSKEWKSDSRTYDSTATLL